MDREPPNRQHDLAARLVDGDETALARLYDLHAAEVYALAARVTREYTAAQDVTQEVFVQVWEHPAAFDPERGTLRAWLGTLAQRRAVDWVRREDARRRRDRPALPAAADGADTEHEAITATFADRVRTAVASLPLAQRSAILLAYFEGMTYREVASALGIPEGAAKSRMRLGLQRLAHRLDAEGIRP